MSEIKEEINARLESAVLLTAGGAIKLERKNISVLLTEDISYPFVECILSYSDSEGDFEDYDISGGEIIKLEISLPKIGEEFTIRENFFVYEVSNIEYANEVSYTFKSLSVEYTKSCNNLISEVYKGKISKTVEKIIKEKILDKEDTDTEIFISDKIIKTESTDPILIPNYDPYKAINYCAVQTYSTDNDVFIFYKSTQGFMFVGFKELFEQEVVDFLKFKVGFGNKANKDEDEKETNNIESSQTEFTIPDISIRMSNNYLEGLNSHVFAGEVMTHNLLTQKTKVHKFSLEKDHDDIPKTGSKNVHSVYGLLDKKFIEGTGVTKLISESESSRDKNINMFLRNYTIYSLQNSIEATFSLPKANGAVRAGGVIEIEFPTSNVKKNQDAKDNPDPNERLSGKYLVKTVEHNFTGDFSNLSYEITVTAVKNGIEE